MKCEIYKSLCESVPSLCEDLEFIRLPIQNILHVMLSEPPLLHLPEIGAETLLALPSGKDKKFSGENPITLGA